MKNSLGLQLESEQRNFSNFRWGGKSGKFFRKRACEGFTLVELIVVIVILAILAAILVPGLLGWIDKAKEKKYELEARSIAMAAQAEVAKMYAKDNKPSFVIFAGSAPAEGGKALSEIQKLSGINDIDGVNVYFNDNNSDWSITAIWITYTSGDGKNMHAIWHVNELPQPVKEIIMDTIQGNENEVKGSEEGWIFVETDF